MILKGKIYKAKLISGKNYIPSNQTFSLNSGATLVDYDWNGKLPHTKALFFEDNSVTRQVQRSIVVSGTVVFSVYVRMADNSEPEINTANGIVDFSIEFIGTVGVSTILKKHLGNNIWRLSVSRLSGSFTSVRVLKGTNNTSKSFYVYGYQVEGGTIPSRYTPTSGTAVFSPFPIKTQIINDEAIAYKPQKLLMETEMIFERARQEGFTVPDSKAKWRINRQIKKMIQDGSWQQQDVFFKFGHLNTGLANFSLINWKNPFGITNLATYSNDWSNSGWLIGVPADCNKIPNTTDTLAPDGTQTACKFEETNTGGTSVNIKQNVTAISSTLTYSIYTKAGTAPFRTFLLRDSTANVNVAGGTFTYGGGGSFSNLYGTTSFENVGNGWFRLTMTATNCIVGNSYSIYFGRTSIAAAGLTWYCWGAQVEDRNKASKYTPTTSVPIYGNGLASVHGGIIYTNNGWQCNDIDAYIDTHFNPVLSGKKYTASNAGFGAVFYQQNDDFSSIAQGNGTVNRTMVTNLISASQRVNNLANLTATIDMSGSGFFYLGRHGGTNIEYTNKATNGTATSGDTGTLYSGPFTLGKTPSNDYSAIKIATFFAGGNLTSSQRQNFRSEENQYFNDIGLPLIA